MKKIKSRCFDLISVSRKEFDGKSKQVLWELMANVHRYIEDENIHPGTVINVSHRLNRKHESYWWEAEIEVETA